MENSNNKRQVSRILHWVGDITSHANFAAFIAIGVSIFMVVLVAAGMPGAWEAAFATVAAAVTLVMVFVIQHTQSRQQVATQLKLDELIRSIPQADDLLVHIEAAHDDELIEQERRQIDHHTSIRRS